MIGKQTLVRQLAILASFSFSQLVTINKTRGIFRDLSVMSLIICMMSLIVLLDVD